jgi:hypothetical protein
MYSTSYTVKPINIIIIILRSLFDVCPSDKHCSSVRFAYAANAVGKHLDIFAIRAVSLIHIYTRQPKSFHIIC